MNKQDTPKQQIQLDIERKLLPRVKFMGYVLFVLSLATLAFAIGAGLWEMNETDPIASLMSEEELLELNPLEVLNFYVVAFVFALLATFFFLLHWKKSKLLLQETEVQK